MYRQAGALACAQGAKRYWHPLSVRSQRGVKRLRELVLAQGPALLNFEMSDGFPKGAQLRVGFDDGLACLAIDSEVPNQVAGTADMSTAVD